MLLSPWDHTCLQDMKLYNNATITHLKCSKCFKRVQLIEYTVQIAFRVQVLVKNMAMQCGNLDIQLLITLFFIVKLLLFSFAKRS